MSLLSALLVLSVLSAPAGESQEATLRNAVSAPFCGMLGRNLIVSGGADFPDRPLVEGGEKKYYDEIWRFRGGRSRLIGRLPDPTAYGATYRVGNALVFAGGNASGKTTDKVYKLKRGLFGYRLKPLAPLPAPVEQAGATADKGILYLAGGISPEGSDAVYSCNPAEGEWKRIATLPVPLVQPVAFASNGKLYVWGGFEPSSGKALSEGWCLDIASGEWTPAPGVPDGGTFVGTSGITVGGRLVTVGGVNKDIFTDAQAYDSEQRIEYLSREPSAYRFRKEMYCFDPASRTWSQVCTSDRLALAGPGMSWKDGSIYIAGGETKPGIRTDRVVVIEIKE